MSCIGTPPGTPSQQPTLHGLQHFGLQKAKKCARVCVQHELQEDVVGQLAVQLLQDDPHPPPQDDPQPIRHGSRQLSERSPRRTDSSRHGRGQQLPTDGGGIGVQHDGAAQLGAAQLGAAHVGAHVVHLGAHVVQVGTGVPHELQPPPLRANRLKPTGLITE